MQQRKQDIINTVTALAAPCAQRLGLVLWDVEYVREGADYYLRITIDSKNGVDLNACENMSRELEPLLDAADPIEDSYQLEVSSPGVERLLRTPEHIMAYMGNDVRAKLFKAHPGTQKKEFTGKLTAYDAEEKAVTLDCDGETVVLKIKDITKINGYFDFAKAKKQNF
jgi:Uncharacterized protein conserved in bacteria